MEDARTFAEPARKCGNAGFEDVKLVGLEPMPQSLVVARAFLRQPFTQHFSSNYTSRFTLLVADRLSGTEEWVRRSLVVSNRPGLKMQISRKN
jgi:hypothetical protein